MKTATKIDIGRIKSVTVSQGYVDGTFKNIIGVNGVKHYFDGFHLAAKFARDEWSSFEKEGFDGCVGVFSTPLTKAEQKYITGKKRK